MGSHSKISILPALVAGLFAIVLVIASVPAFAQSPATGASASAAPSVVATAMLRPAAVASPTAAGVHPPDGHTVISYLSDVINWYGHLGVEAQLVRDPDETLFFADDRQTADEVLKLAFEYARAQAAFIAKTSPNTAAAGAAPARTVANDAGTGAGAAELGNITHTLKTLGAAANALLARLSGLQAQLGKAPAAKRAAIAAEIQGAQNELDLNQARGDALNALEQYESGSASQDQSGTLTAQIDELEHSISDSSKKPPAETAPVASVAPSGIVGTITELIALGTKLDALDEDGALAQTLSARAAEVRGSILAQITSLDARGSALARGAGAADVATLKDRKQKFENLLDEHKPRPTATASGRN